MRRTQSFIALTLAFALLGPACSDDTKTPVADFRQNHNELGGNTEGPVGGDATIYDINQKKIAEGASVTLRDVVVTAVDGYGKYTGDVYVQEVKGGAYSGLKLFAPQRTDGGNVTDLKIGDHVKVTGTVKYFTPASSPFPDGKKVIELDKGCQISRLQGGAPPAAAEPGATDFAKEETALPWTFVLVKVSNQAVTRPLDSYNEFDLANGLPVAEEMYLHTPKFGDCVTVTGIAGYFYGYKLWPRSADDIATGTGCPAVKTVTIKDIQDEKSANHPAVDSTVAIENVVVTAVDSTLSTASSGKDPQFVGFWVQDPAGGVRSGIYVYYYWYENTKLKPVVGNKVDVYGQYQEYKAKDATRSISEIGKVFFVDKGAGTMPAAEVVNAADIATGGAKADDYEGVLVKVENAEVAELVKTTGTTPKTVGIKLKTSNLNVENELFDFVATPPAVGDKYTSITGPLHYSFGNFKILPRTAADVVK